MQKFPSMKYYIIVGNPFEQGVNTMNLTEILTLDSREVASMINKSHNDLLKDIRRYGDYLIEGKIPLNDFWQESTYKDKIGRSLKCYQITKKGCEFLAHKMTGKKGAIFTATYINRFYEMEEELNNTPSKITLRHTKWSKEKVMTTRDFWQITGVPQGNVNWFLKKFNLEYWILTGKDLRKYKELNNLKNCVTSSMTLIPSYSAIILVKKLDLWTKELQKSFGDYFKPYRDLIVADKQESLALDTDELISIRSEKIIAKINELKRKLIAVDVLLDELIDIRRTKRDHERYGENILKLLYSSSSDMFGINKII